MVVNPQLGEGEEVKHVQEGVTVFIDDKPAHGRGALFVSTHNVIWQPDAGSAAAKLSLHWRSILMHAVSRDPATFPHPCIYCQVQGCQEILGAGVEEEEEDGDEKLNEVRFVVEDEQVLSVLFAVFSECQALHPDDVEQDEGDFMFNVEEVEEGALGGGGGLEMPTPADVDMLTGDDAMDRFADAEEEG